MTLEKTREILRKYAEMIRARHPDVEAKDQSGYIALFGYAPKDNKLIEHGLFMCQKAIEFEGLVRANRWLGFIQCILLVHHIAGLDDMRIDTRPGPDESSAPPKPGPSSPPDTAPDTAPETTPDTAPETAPEVEPETEPASAPETEPASEGEVKAADADEAFERLTGEPSADSEEE